MSRELDLYGAAHGLPMGLARQTRRELIRIDARSRVELARAERAIERQAQLTGQVQDQVALLAMKEAAYAAAFPHAAHRLAWVGDQSAMAMIETIRGAR